MPVLPAIDFSDPEKPNWIEVVDVLKGLAESCPVYVGETPELIALRAEFKKLSSVDVQDGGTNALSGEARQLRLAMRHNLGCKREDECVAFGVDPGWKIFYKKGEIRGEVFSKLMKDDDTKATVIEYQAAISYLKNAGVQS